jgi:hypothetical protein
MAKPHLFERGHTRALLPVRRGPAMRFSDHGYSWTPFVQSALTKPGADAQNLRL